MLERRGYKLNKKDKSYNKIKTTLTVKPKLNETFINKEEIDAIENYDEDDDSIYIPRYYAQSIYNTNLSPTESCKKINIKFTGNLWEYQKHIVDKCHHIFKNTGGGIIQAGCGSGKTTMAIKTICDLGVKTLIIVHKTFLLNQWEDRIKQFSTATIGRIQGDKIDIDKNIVIGMLQSISMRDYEDTIFNDFGYVIVDECHHIAAKVFSRALRKCGFKYTLGLSATPYRSDGLVKVIYWYLGNIICKYNRPIDQLHPQVKQIIYKSTDKLFVVKKMYTKKGLVDNISRIISNICLIKSRNKLIIRVIFQCLKQEGRKILVLSDRIEHLEKLNKMFIKEIQNQIKKKQIEPDEYKSNFYIGKMKEKERLEAIYADVLFASYPMAGEGLDIKELNTLILASPKRCIEQSVGRIMRNQDVELNPLIIDITDQISSFKTQGKTRYKFYNKNKYGIQHLYAIDKYLIFEENYNLGKTVNKLKLRDNLFKVVNSHINVNKSDKIKYDDEPFSD